MKQTGIIRRIDNLGRIVIPKEIRRILHIHDGEMIEMMVNDSNIILKKYSTVRENVEIFDNLIGIFSNHISSDVIITDLDKVISSTDKKCIDKQISKFFFDFVKQNKEYISSGKEEVTIVDGISSSTYLILPIISSYDLVGLLILFSTDEVLSSEDITYCRLLNQVINEYIDE